MLDKEFKLEGKIRNGSMFHSQKKFWKFEAQFDLKDQGQGHNFQNHTTHLDDK